jgi:hypothetical protein
MIVTFLLYRDKEEDDDDDRFVLEFGLTRPGNEPTIYRMFSSGRKTLLICC